MIETQTFALASREQNIAVEDIPFNERIPTLKEHLQLLAMLPQQRQKTLPMQCRNICYIRQQNVLLSNQTRGQRRPVLKEATVALNATDQILDILFLCADQFDEHIATALFRYIAAGRSCAHAAAPMLFTALAPGPHNFLCGTALSPQPQSALIHVQLFLNNSIVALYYLYIL